MIYQIRRVITEPGKKTSTWKEFPGSSCRGSFVGAVAVLISWSCLAIVLPQGWRPQPLSLSSRAGTLTHSVILHPKHFTASSKTASLRLLVSKKGHVPTERYPKPFWRHCSLWGVGVCEIVVLCLFPLLSCPLGLRLKQEIQLFRNELKTGEISTPL